MPDQYSKRDLLKYENLHISGYVRKKIQHLAEYKSYNQPKVGKKHGIWLDITL